MNADLETLLTTVYCMADDLLPCKAGNAKRIVTDAEVVALAVAQAIMGIPSDERFIAAAGAQLRHLFPKLPQRPGYAKRRCRLAERIEGLIDAFARECPGYHDSVVLLDSTPVECGRSRETVERSALADAAGYGYCRSHSRWFWGMRLHACFGADGTPRALALWSADRPEREVALELLPRTLCGGEAVVCDKGYASAGFEAKVAELGALVCRPPRKDEAEVAFRPSPIRQRVESIFCTLKDVLTLERHGARTLEGLRVRIAQRLLALAAGVYVNYWLGRPSRALSAFAA
jgi:hypothetical protein